MKTVSRKRIEIVVEATLRRRVIRLLDNLGVTGYTILPVKAGRGDSGEWSREGQVSSASEMIMVICITTEDRAEAVAKDIAELVSPGGGIFNITNVEVLRAEKF